MADEVGRRWHCPDTGLMLITAPEVRVWRIFQRRYRSPLNPPRRTGGAVTEWSRFDLAGHATLYGAELRRGAFLENLAYAGYDRSGLPLHAIFSDVAPEDDPVADEWEALSHMPPGQIPATWRQVRQSAPITLRNDGHYVDITASETLGALRRAMSTWVPGTVRTPDPLDIADLTGKNRALTCSAASWLARQTAQDGKPVKGVRYVSKHGTDITCWVLWTAVPDDDVESALRGVAAHERPTDIAADDPDLRWAALQLDVTVR